MNQWDHPTNSDCVFFFNDLLLLFSYYLLMAQFTNTKYTGMRLALFSISN